MNEKEKNTAAQLDDNKLASAAGGKEENKPEFSFDNLKKIYKCPECGKDIEIFNPIPGASHFGTCPHCRKGISFMM